MTNHEMRFSESRGVTEQEIATVAWPGKDAEFGNITDPQLLAVQRAEENDAEERRRRGVLDDEDEDEVSLVMIVHWHHPLSPCHPIYPWP